jgi:hypothetical protein
MTQFFAVIGAVTCLYVVGMLCALIVRVWGRD